MFPESGNMARVLPEYLSKWAMDKVQAEGVSVRPNTRLNSVEYKDGKVVMNVDDGKSVCRIY
jgi:programmed cell death 8 (apoptosis-inducing factor)